MLDELKEQSGKSEAPKPVKTERPDLLASLRSEIDRLFDDFAWRWPASLFGDRERGLLAPPARFPASWPGNAPAVDIVDLDNEIQVCAELPGMEEKDIDIEVSGDMLTIRGEKKEETEKGEKGSRYYMSERRYGSFERSLRIPEGADRDKPEARFVKGVLTVSFPKTPEARAKARKVEIKSK